MYYYVSLCMTTDIKGHAVTIVFRPVGIVYLQSL